MAPLQGAVAHANRWNQRTKPDLAFGQWHTLMRLMKAKAPSISKTRRALWHQPLRVGNTIALCTLLHAAESLLYRSTASPAAWTMFGKTLAKTAVLGALVVRAQRTLMGRSVSLAQVTPTHGLKALPEGKQRGKNNLQNNCKSGQFGASSSFRFRCVRSARQTSRQSRLRHPLQVDFDG